MMRAFVEAPLLRRELSASFQGLGHHRRAESLETKFWALSGKKDAGNECGQPMFSLHYGFLSIRNLYFIIFIFL